MVQLQQLKQNGIRQSEFKLYPQFKRYFENIGWKIITSAKKINYEGNQSYGDIDILGFKNNELLAGEIKIIPTETVFLQAVRNKVFADYIFVGFIGEPSFIQPKDGIGIYSIPKVYISRTFPNNRVYYYSCFDLDANPLVIKEMEKNINKNEFLKKRYIELYFI